MHSTTNSEFYFIKDLMTWIYFFFSTKHAPFNSSYWKSDIYICLLLLLPNKMKFTDLLLFNRIHCLWLNKALKMKIFCPSDEVYRSKLNEQVTLRPMTKELFLELTNDWNQVTFTSKFSPSSSVLTFKSGKKCEGSTVLYPQPWRRRGQAGQWSHLIAEGIVLLPLSDSGTWSKLKWK